MKEWFAMGGHGFFIWSSYAMLALAVVIELRALRQRRKAAWEQVDEVREQLAPQPPGQRTETE